MSLLSLEKFDCNGESTSVGVRRERWKRALYIYLEASNIDKDVKKRASLLHFAGFDLQEVFYNVPGANIEPSEGVDVFKVAISKLDSYFAPKQSKIYERHTFRLLKQEPDEKFLVRLRKQADKCQFAERDENIIDQITEKCYLPDLRKNILQIGDEITLDRVICKGLFRYKILMFGISCAPEIFQKPLERMVLGCEGVVNYIDNILIHGKDLYEHDSRLKKVMSVLKDNNVVIRNDKCSFRMRKVSFLGHELSAEGVRPLKKYISTIKEFRAPRTTGELQSFLDLVNYVSKWIPSYTTVTEPHKTLLRNKNGHRTDIAEHWGPEQQPCFESLKEIMTNISSLGFYDVNDRTIVIADASPVGLGGVLVQINFEGDPRIIAYGHKTLTECERRYCQTEKEAIALVWAVEHFQIFLYGKEFELITDHKPLEVIFGTKSKTSANVWWPRCDKDAENIMKACKGCTLVSAPCPPNPMKRRELAEGPWIDIAIDLMGPLPSGDHLFVVVDYYSRYKEVKICRKITSKEIVAKLKEIFCRLGNPISITADNGRQLISEEFKSFLTERNVSLFNKVPYWPQQNGEVERQNRDILKRLKISLAENKDWKESFLDYLTMYNSTPHSVTGRTPSELFFNRKFRDKLPMVSGTMESISQDTEVKDRDQEIKEKRNEYGDRKRKAEECDLAPGDKVYIKNMNRENKLSLEYNPETHTVENKKGGDITVRNDETGQIRRRNVVHLKKIQGEWSVCPDRNEINDEEMDVET